MGFGSTTAGILLNAVLGLPKTSREDPWNTLGHFKTCCGYLQARCNHFPNWEERGSKFISGLKRTRSVFGGYPQRIWSYHSGFREYLQRFYLQHIYWVSAPCLEGICVFRGSPLLISKWFFSVCQMSSQRVSNDALDMFSWISAGFLWLFATRFWGWSPGRDTSHFRCGCNSFRGCIQ